MFGVPLFEEQAMKVAIKRVLICETIENAQAAIPCSSWARIRRCQRMATAAVSLRTEIS